MGGALISQLQSTLRPSASALNNAVNFRDLFRLEKDVARDS
jgi:hypothetical protein